MLALMLSHYIMYTLKILSCSRLVPVLFVFR